MAALLKQFRRVLPVEIPESSAGGRKHAPKFGQIGLLFVQSAERVFPENGMQLAAQITQASLQLGASGLVGIRYDEFPGLFKRFVEKTAYQVAHRLRAGIELKRQF